MNRKLLLILAALLCCTGLWAEPLFESGKKYRIVCDRFGSGGIATGAAHGSTARLFYTTDNNVAADAWWYITKSGDGYVLQNASTLEYVAYDPERIEGVCKGLSLYDTPGGDEFLWNFQKTDDSYYIVNVAQPEQWFNVRVDGTYLVGTYASHGGRAENECFKFYDEAGRLVGEEGDGSSASDVIAGDRGQTTDGAWWERTGLAQPVAFTTDADAPILYTIRNVRTGKYLWAEGDALLQETGRATQFYFVEGADGANIYTADGQYVSGWVNTASLSTSPVSLADGTTATNDNTWTLGFYATENEGYTVGVATCSANSQWGTSTHTYWNDYNGNFVGFYTVDAGSTFIFCSTDRRHVEYLASQGVELDGYASDRFDTYVSALRINDKTPATDAEDGSYLLPLPVSLRGGDGADLTLDATWTDAADGCTLSLDGLAPADDGATFSLAGDVCLTDHTLCVVGAEGDTLARATLRLTFLPVIEVNVMGCNSYAYTAGTLRVSDGNFMGDEETMHAKFRWRGATALGYEKKSYAVKLTDANGEDMDASFLGMRDDNNWILDAMAIDPACMRNRVSTDLWNDFASDPYHKDEEPGAIAGTRGKFVEVFLNGTYHGLYCLTEKVDRKQLKLKKFEPAEAGHDAIIHGTLYKSAQWSYEVLMGHEQDQRNYPRRAPSPYNNNNRSETWCQYEVKYPDYEDEPIDWAPLYNAVNFVATASDDDFDNYVGRYFDRPVVDDYYLFIELMLATDNHGKNMYFFTYDSQDAANGSKLGITPWDLDGTWGRRWDGSSSLTGPEQDFDTFLWAYEHGNLTLFTRLAESSYINWPLVLANRYARLRRTHFAPDALKERFAAYRDLFAESGADAREARRWPSLHSDIAADVNRICTWIDRRVAFLDEQYDYEDTSTGIDAATAGHRPAVTGGKGCLYVRLDAPARIDVYTAGGLCVRRIDAPAGHTRVDGIAPGVYIVGGQKTIVR